jgi:hypothetical protein
MYVEIERQNIILHLYWILTDPSFAERSHKGISRHSNGLEKLLNSCQLNLLHTPLFYFREDAKAAVFIPSFLYTVVPSL